MFPIQARVFVELVPPSSPQRTRRIWEDTALSRVACGESGCR
jgi:hypothetical protein